MAIPARIYFNLLSATWHRLATANHEQCECCEKCLCRLTWSRKRHSKEKEEREHVLDIWIENESRTERIFDKTRLSTFHVKVLSLNCIDFRFVVTIFSFFSPLSPIMTYYFFLLCLPIAHTLSAEVLELMQKECSRKNKYLKVSRYLLLTRSWRYHRCRCRAPAGCIWERSLLCWWKWHFSLSCCCF